MQIRNNAMLDRIALKAGLPIPPPGPDPGDSIDALRERLLARRAQATSKAAPAEPAAPAQPKSIAEPAGLEAAIPEAAILVSQTEPSASTRAEINRRNALLSTGPRSPEGKVASSRNSLKHGLAASLLIIPGEDLTGFKALLNAFLEEHQPATTTEEVLVTEMAQSHWLTQRAIRLQNDCFTGAVVDDKRLALFLRYQTTHQRAFYKALSNLLALKKASLKTAAGFVSRKTSVPEPGNSFASQKLPTPEPASGFVSHTASQPDLHTHMAGQNSRL